MRYMTVTFRIPTGYIGCDLEEEQFFSFEDDTAEEDIRAEIESEFSNWVEDMLEDMRMSAEYDIEEEDEEEEEL